MPARAAAAGLVARGAAEAVETDRAKEAEVGGAEKFTGLVPPPSPPTSSPSESSDTKAGTYRAGMTMEGNSRKGLGGGGRRLLPLAVAAAALYLVAGVRPRARRGVAGCAAAEGSEREGRKGVAACMSLVAALEKGTLCSTGGSAGAAAGAPWALLQVLLLALLPTRTGVMCITAESGCC